MVTNARTVLVLEDDPDSAVPLLKILRSEGYRVLTARDIPSARECLRTGRPDLILADVELGTDGGDSHAFVTEVLAAQPDTKVVRVTSVAEDNIPEEARGCGVVRKPVRIEELLALMRA